MKSMKSLLVAANFALALAFTFGGCSGDDGGDDTPSSSSGGVVVPSSSSNGGSSSSGGGTGGVYECDPNGTNPTVPIGSQTWMKCNLNVPHNSGNGESWCYEGTDYSTGSAVSITAEEGCAKYGRLYDLAAAMNLPSECNSISCASQIQSLHQGICPAGFHVPSDEEWQTLVEYADPDFVSITNNIAASKLKSASGWFPYEGISSTDEYGFSALPGGYRSTAGFFSNADRYGYWRSTSEYDASTAYSRTMSNNNDYVNKNGNVKSVGHSIRCIKDN
jgi:uncharacterized protein (TIGR02145 family)